MEREWERAGNLRDVPLSDSVGSPRLAPLIELVEGPDKPADGELFGLLDSFHATDAERVAELKERVLQLMRSEGMDSVEVSYDGYGDEGSVEVGDEVSAELREALEDLADCGVPGDWVNNEGGYGTLVVDARSGAVEVEFNERYTDVRTTYYRG